MKKSVKTLLAFLVLGVMGFTFLACNNPFLARGESGGRTTFTVDFEQNGGTYIDKRVPPKYTKAERQIIAEGGKASNPGLVERDGFYLGGWYTNPDFSGEAWSFTVQPVTQDIVLYARWEEIGYDVQFDLRGLSVASLNYVPVTEKIASGARATEPLEFGSKDKQYGFHGWYKEPACVNLWDFKTDVVTKDTTLYAKWDRPSPTSGGGGSGGGGSGGGGSGGGGGTPAPTPDPDPTPTPDPDPTPTPDPDPTPTPDPDPTPEPDPDPTPTPDPDPTPTPDPEPEPPVVLYSVEWDTGDPSIAPPESQNLLSGARIVPPYAILKPGFAFSGWFLDAAFTRQWNFATDIVSDSAVRETQEDGTKVIILYAKWVVKDFITVTFDSAGGTPVPEPQNVPLSGGILTKPEKPVKGGEEFDAWYSDTGYSRAGRWRFSAAVSADMTLYARWVDELPGFSWVPGGDVDGYYIGETEVTNAQYSAIMGNAPSNWTDVNNPVNQVSWYEAVEYCNARSTQEGLAPVYTISGREPATGYPVLTATVDMNPSAGGYRLPTVAEWVSAAKGGGYTPETTTYPGSNDVNEVAWYDKNSESRTHPVAQKKPNSLGLYDMSGNVSEWCWDPAGATDRHRRGGNWNMIETNIVPGRKDQFRMTDPNPRAFWTIGFRVGRSLPY